MQVIDIIRTLRGSGMTQMEISERTGISQPKLSRWENGEIPASADDALKLQSLLIATPDVPQEKARAA